MRDRIEILNDIIKIKGNLLNLETEISHYPWDSKNALLTILKSDLMDILKKALNEEITADELKSWSNIIECRDDLDFEQDKVKEIIFELANPEINGEINKIRLREIINELNQA